MLSFRGNSETIIVANFRGPLREDGDGDPGRVGLVPGPAGDDADAHFGIGDGIDKGGIRAEAKMKCTCFTVSLLQFKRMLNKELNNFSESRSGGAQVSEYIYNTFISGEKTH